MPALNWSTFEGLPGSANANFEVLCRAIIRRHYGQFGDFRALANQPGVEFHLKLRSACELGASGRWYGWQCRWYDLPSGTPIGVTRRESIEDALAKTEARFPEMSDWVLWTRHVLTKSDQEWFYALSSKMRLVLWSAADVESHLNGAAAILRETYFGELILTPASLREMHEKAVAPIRRRWQPELHQVVDAERALQRMLGARSAWSDLVALKETFDKDILAVCELSRDTPMPIGETLGKLIGRARQANSSAAQAYTLLEGGQYEILSQKFTESVGPSKEELHFLRRLRGARNPIALHVTNVLADMYNAQRLLATMHVPFAALLTAVAADAGYGKTQLAAQVTAPTTDRSAGVLLRGRHLAAGQSLDQLAQREIVHGSRVESFEALIAAVDAAGQRQSRRLPIVIDGLNEAEDPRDWRDQLASLEVVLGRNLNVQVVCTLRSAFISESLPHGVAPLEIEGFDNDLIEAVRRYFEHYKIDASDAELPLRLLNHPLTLRIFCEVSNPDRKKTVGAGALPGSMSTLFERYLEQVADRIAELAPRAHRYYQSDVRTALGKVGFALWSDRARSVEIPKLRALLKDEGQPWDQSIVRALEQEGILFREPGERPGPGNMSIVYDALAGHIIADALLGEYAGNRFDAWLRDSRTVAALGKDAGKRHPLAFDIFRALVALAPRRMSRRQLWPILEGQMQRDAVHEAAFLDSPFLDQETVARLTDLLRLPTERHHDLFDRLFTTRAAQYHALNAEFLDGVLRPMSVADRDLRWSEWIRRKQTELIQDLERLTQRWKRHDLKAQGDYLRARWIMWTLTSTVRLLRDHATYALYWFGCNDPSALFELTLDSLEINDSYVPERMLAACCGVAMSLWADPKGDKVRSALPQFANRLVQEMFVPGAAHATVHNLMRGYALSTIALAIKIDAACVPNDTRCYLAPPFEQLPSPFPPADKITDADIAKAEGSINMDFGNYTLGRLIRGRSNYDYENKKYKEVRRQIENRIVQLGYSSRFEAIDRAISNEGWRAESRGKPTTDRYGKKYSWIAYFEMYGFQSDKGELPEWRDEVRSPDVDIDPSFPERPRTHLPALPDLFSASPAEPRAWISGGPSPAYENLRNPSEVDGQRGPWVLLEGYIEQSAPSDSRRIFSFLRGVLVKKRKSASALRAFNAITYPGNSAIPERLKDYYTYAGEIPWSEHFGTYLRDEGGKAKRNEEDAFSRHDGRRWLRGIKVEIPSHTFSWESYHSRLNQVSGVDVPAPALCDRLGLRNRQGQWDFYDPLGNLATVYREFKDTQDSFGSSLLYLRADLMAEYLSEGDLDLLWFVWGERGFYYKDAPKLNSELHNLFEGHREIHRHSAKWER
jgi:hypothetical protein